MSLNKISNFRKEEAAKLANKPQPAGGCCSHDHGHGHGHSHGSKNDIDV